MVIKEEDAEGLLKSEQATYGALKNANMSLRVLKAQQLRIDYLQTMTSPVSISEKDASFQSSFLSADLPITKEKLIWKIKTLKRKTLIERQYVEAAARLEMAYTDLDESCGVNEEDRERVEQSLYDARQRYIILQKALQKWTSLCPEYTEDNDDFFNEDTANKSPCKFWGKVDVEIEEQDDFLLRAVTEKETIISAGFKFTIKCEGESELELQYLNKQTRNLHAIAFIPLPELFSESKSYHEEIEMEPNSSLTLKMKLKPRPASKIERHPAIIRKTINGHQMESGKKFHLKKCSGCGDFCFSLNEGISCISCRVFCHRKCTSLLPTRCLAPSDDYHHQRTSESDIMVVDYRKQHQSTFCKVFLPTWCSHCGLLVPFGSKSGVKCEDCGKVWHATCQPLVPLTCGIVKLLEKLPISPAKSITSMSVTGSASSLQNYELMAVLGRGNFGKVMLAKELATEVLYAIKILKKRKIVENEEYENVKTEHRVLELATREKHPFLIHLKECFQDEERVYFVMEYAAGGDLLFHIQEDERFSAPDKRVLAAQILLALHFLHQNGVIYRDLKMDNILLDALGNVKLADYGLAKDGVSLSDGMTKTYCGTPEFMAPEIFRQKPYNRAVDWWSFGVLLYELFLQKAPFKGNSEQEIQKSVLNKKIDFPERIDATLKDLIEKLLTLNPLLRLGSGPKDAKEIMKHLFFKDIPWDDLRRSKGTKRWITSFQPSQENKGLGNFDHDFTKEPPFLLTPRHFSKSTTTNNNSNCSKNELEPNVVVPDDPFDAL